METSNFIAPVVKWVGGKRQLIQWIKSRVPPHTTYYEPFVGGGAVLFALQPEKAVVNDVNEELMNLYQVIKENVDDLILDLKTHKNDKRYFYSIRALDRDKEKYEALSRVQKASRMIYLNKTCYNGLFRVNRQGEFNSPFGRYKNPNILNEDTLKAVSDYFNKIKISLLCGDYERALKQARKGDFVYIDPPYDPISITSSFTGYDKGGFDKTEQVRLKNMCDKLDKRGVRFLLSNSATDFIKELYKGYFIDVISARRSINSDPTKRFAVEEVLVRNYE
jgi:DNA adenine methylase